MGGWREVSSAPLAWYGVGLGWGGLGNSSGRGGGGGVGKRLGGWMGPRGVVNLERMGCEVDSVDSR